MLVDLMSDLGDQIGRVIEHERSNAHLADLLWREQQELLNNLHDSLGQSLTAVGVLSSALSQRLTAIDSVAAETGQEIAQQAHVAQDQVRQLARGLFPGEIEGDGLMPALRELRSTTESIHKIRVEIEGEASRPVLDSRAATQLFRIIQEGVTNAVRHAKADTIRIAVKAGPGLVRVGVIDNGIGMPAAAAAPREGMGLRIMAHRASSIGAHLSIGASPGGGTTVACTWREVPSLRAPTRS
jgi:two-component system sensor histidine kinase UhpB